MRIKIILITIFLFSCVFGFAQDPIHWRFFVNKIADKTFEIHLVAQVDNPWHIYSQSTPDGGPVKTVFVFTKNPLISFIGKVDEQGKIIKKHEDVFDVDVKYFEKEVDFVQKIKLKWGVITNVSGAVEYMVCTNQQCLTPQKRRFSVKVE